MSTETIARRGVGWPPPAGGGPVTPGTPPRGSVVRTGKFAARVNSASRNRASSLDENPTPAGQSGQSAGAGIRGSLPVA
jgi:hypothetical protein